MKNLKISVLALSVAIFTSCDMEQTRKTELPDIDVDVDAEAGQLPAFDVDWADVNVGTRTKIVEVPKVVIVMEEEEIEVPYIDVDMPDDYEDKEKMERSLIISADVIDKQHDLTIREIRATENRLYVIATLEELDTDLDGKKMRVQDQVELNAPDLDVQYVIVGKKPNSTYNNQYTYVSSMDDLNSRIANANVIYKS